MRQGGGKSLFRWYILGGKPALRNNKKKKKRKRKQKISTPPQPNPKKKTWMHLVSWNTFLLLLTKKIDEWHRHISPLVTRHLPFTQHTYTLNLIPFIRSELKQWCYNIVLDSIFQGRLSLHCFISRFSAFLSRLFARIFYCLSPLLVNYTSDDDLTFFQQLWLAYESRI